MVVETLKSLGRDGGNLKELGKGWWWRKGRGLGPLVVSLVVYCQNCLSMGIFKVQETTKQLNTILDSIMGVSG